MSWRGAARWWAGLWGVPGLLAGWMPVAGSAHPAYLTAATITVERDGTFHGEVRFDTLAFVLNDTSVRIGNEPMEELLTGPPETLATQLAGARERFAHGFRVETDAGNGAAESADFPDARQVLAWRDEMRPVLPVVLPIQVSGRVPTGAHTAAFRFPSVLEQVILTVERPDEEPVAEAVEAGKTSTPLPVRIVPAPLVDQPDRKVGAIKAAAAASSTGARPRLIAGSRRNAARDIGLAAVLLAGLATGYRWYHRRSEHKSRG